MRHLKVLVMLTLLLCGCDGPRTAAMSREQALRDDRVMRLQVVKVYDNKDLEWLDEYNVSHVLDVDVLDGPPELVGKSLTLPYDLFFMAKPPPAAGEVVVTAPVDWVKRSLTGKVRGFGQ